MNSAWMRSERVGAAARHWEASSGEGAGKSKNKEPVTDPSASSRTHLAVPCSKSISDSSPPTVTNLHHAEDETQRAVLSQMHLTAVQQYRLLVLYCMKG